MATPLDTLRESLRNLADDTPVRATIERALTSEQKDSPPRQGAVAVTASLGNNGLQIDFPADQLKRADLEHAQTDPDQPHPTIYGLSTIDPVEVSALLGYSKRLLADLDGATLINETAGSYLGAPARLLELSLPTKLAREDRKHVTEASITMKIWCGADGLPLGLEEHEQFKGRVFLIIGFEAHESRTLQFAHVGNRLTVLRDERNAGGSGMGESGSEARVTTLKLL